MKDMNQGIQNILILKSIRTLFFKKYLHILQDIYCCKWIYKLKKRLD